VLICITCPVKPTFDDIKQEEDEVDDDGAEETRGKKATAQDSADLVVTGLRSMHCMQHATFNIHIKGSMKYHRNTLSVGNLLMSISCAVLYRDWLQMLK
jgi:hypothetical protein